MAISPLSVSVALIGALAILYTQYSTEDQAQHGVNVTKIPSIRLPDHVSRFAPMHLTECTETMPDYYAPCFAKNHKHAVVAEEVVYPPFQVSAPIFAPSRPLDSQKWWDIIWIIWERAYRLGDRLRYNEKHGQLFVFENVTLSESTVFDNWDMKACMASFSPTSFVQPSDEPPTHDRVLLANVPDSWSWQHFKEHVMPVMAQAQEYDAQHVVTGRESDPFVAELWSSLGYPKERIMNRATNFVASKLIWSCRTPFASPWLSTKKIAMMHPKALEPKPLADRKVVMYMTRNAGRTLENDRQVTNEEALLKNIQKLLDTRGQNEVLQVFSHKDYTDITELKDFFTENVKAVIGPHGGAMLNTIWCGPDTLAMEFLPSKRPALTVYEAVKLREHQYAALMLDSLNDNNDMEVDIPAVIEILEERLGKEQEDSDKIALAYDWEAEELGV